MSPIGILRERIKMVAMKLQMPLRALQVRVTNAIRAIDKNHLIFIEGNCWGIITMECFRFGMKIWR
jgi:hypothetical protein